MSQQSKVSVDLNRAINVFTKSLMWKISEGHPVDQEEIDALNEMRVEANMKPINISAPSQSSGEKKAPYPAYPHEAPREEKKKAPRKPSHEEENQDSYNPQAIMIN